MSEEHTPKSRAGRLAWIAELGEFPNIGPDEVDPDPSEILAECARGHDGFAGSILAKMRQERASAPLRDAMADDPFHRPQFTDAELESVMARDNSTFVVLELARSGYVTAERAVLAIDEKRRREIAAMPWWKRLVRAVFGVGD